jgi:hypothetical protein
VVVVVVVLVVVTVVVVGALVLVEVEQQKPSAAGSSCVSPRRHTSRIFTVVSNVPAFVGLAQSTTASARGATANASTAPRTPRYHDSMAVSLQRLSSNL